jgi:hypothetical protein
LSSTITNITLENELLFSDKTKLIDKINEFVDLIGK